MAISLTAGTFTASGKTYEPIIEELLFLNKTVGQELVAFDDTVKSATEITEVGVTVAMQAYTAGAPSTNGTLTSTGTVITPVKVMYYQEFNPDTLRASRYGRDMKAGAWNMISDEHEQGTASGEFVKVVLGLYSAKISYNAEQLWYSNILAATQTAIAALTPGTGQTSVGAAEQTYAAATTAGLFDGLITRLIYNGGALGTRIKRLGTTITATNIKAEYDKMYGDIPSLVLAQGDEPCRIYAPYSHIQFINQFNNVATNYKDVFIVTGLGTKDQKVTFYGLEVVFVPLVENCMIAARPSHLLWATDLIDDMNSFKIGNIANNRDDMFIKHVFTIFAHVMNQKYNVLYLG